MAMAVAFKSWYCELCSKGPFGGTKPWNDHLNSQCHKLKEILQYTARQSPFYCDVCNVPTNSRSSLAEHLSSPRHKAAEDRAHEINFMKGNQSNRHKDDIGGSDKTNPCFSRSISCNACGKVFDDSVSAEQHFSSDTHRRNVEYEGMESIQTATSRSLLGSHGSSTKTSITPEENLVAIHGNDHKRETVSRELDFEQKMKQLDLDMEEEVPRINRQSENCSVEEYTFSGSRGYCNVCSIELTSRAHADQHLKGKSHKKAKENSQWKIKIKEKNVQATTVARLPQLIHHQEGEIFNDNKCTKDLKEPNSTRKEYMFDGSRGYCYVCALELTSKPHAEQHLQGQKHRKALDRSTISKVQEQHVPEITRHGEGLLQDHHIKQGVTPMLARGNTGCPEYEWFGNRGRCNICDVELTSEQQKQQHLSGKNHEKNKKKEMFGSNGNQNLQLYCNICEKQFSGPESAAMHYASAKHKQKAQIVGITDYNMTGQDLVPFNIGPDNTKWMTCDICLCRLNSKEQLEIHKKSPKHKAEEEKKMRKMNQAPMFEIRGQEPMPQQFDTNHAQIWTKQESQHTVSPAGFTNPHMHEKKLGYPLRSSTSNTEKVQGIPPPTWESKGPQLSPDPFNVSLGLEQISQNLSQGFLINKISFGELCPEESVQCESTDKKPVACDNLTNSCMLQGSFAANETTPKSAISVVENMEKYDFLRENQNVWKDENTSSEVSLGYHSDFKVEENENPSQDSILSNVSSSSGYSTASDGQNVDHDNAVQLGPQKRSTGSDVARALKNRPRRSNSRKGEGQTLDEENDMPQGNNHTYSKKYEEEAEAMIRKNLEVIEENRALALNNISPNELCPRTSQSPIQALQHYLKQREATRNANDNTSQGKRVESPYAYHKFYCSTCNRPMNNEKAYREHMRGQGHLQKVAVEPAPRRNHTSLLKEFEDYGNLTFDLTKTVPRGYQRELFTKAMEGDTVLFLPTGTGKTLISCMAVSAMLTQNPTRQVVFLVDRVLLVIQQSRYLINELSDRLYTRFDPEKINSSNLQDQLVNRKLRIAALCGGQQSTGGVPLWKHDLIIVTAAFYENLLSQGVLRWSDLSLVVFDEAHHCRKNHPFNRLLQEHQLPRETTVRPKVLGLTASPAGKPTVDETLDMLKSFMANLGNAKMAIVEKNKKELESYQSNADVKVITAESSSKEQSLQLQLQLYLLKSYIKFCAETDMLEQYNLGLKATSQRNLTKEEWIECAKTLDGDLLNSLEVTLDKANPKSNDAAHRLIVANLSTHIKYVCYALNCLFEAGVPLALEELQILMATRESSGFEFARSLGLNCDELLAEYESCQELELALSRERQIPGQPHLTSKINCLIVSLLSIENIDWTRKMEQPMALVLVKQRSTAKKVCSILRTESMVMSLGLSVVYVVGHGTGSAEGGMTVSQQKRLLEEVKDHRHQIIVATSVAEEGIDIPECQLVVSMNPPSTVTALVQMRGRARKIRSKFIIICTDINEKAKMEELQLKESNMTKATAIIVKEQRQRS